MSASAAWLDLGPAIWRRIGRGARLAIVGGVHGEEETAVRIVRELAAPEHPVWTEAPGADVTLAVAHPAAVEIGARHLAGGVDMDRLFGAGRLGPREQGAPEWARAKRLVAALTGVDLLLDLHTTSFATPPLAIVSDTPAHLSLAASLGLEAAVVGVEGLHDGGMLGRWADRQGGLGVTVHLGREGTPEAAGLGRALCRRFLTTPAQPKQGVQVYEVRRAVRSPGPGLHFAPSVQSTSHVAAGEVVARWDGGELTLDEPAVVLFPCDAAAPGSVCMLLAEDRGRWSVR